MAGGNSITMRTSAALRKAGLPVQRWGRNSYGRGLYCRSVGTAECYVSIRSIRPQVLCDEAMAVLTAQGLHAFADHSTLGDGTEAYSITVYAKGSVPAWRLQTEAAVVEAEVTAPEQDSVVDTTVALEAVQLTPTDWRVAHGGRRDAYWIKRTGSGDRTRYAVTAKGQTAPLARLLRSLDDALDAIRTDITA